MHFEFEQILTQIIAFLALFWVLKRFAWKPLLGVLEERKQTIQQEFASIEEQKKEVKRLAETFNAKLDEIENTARATMQEAVNRGRQISQEIESEARQRVNQLLKKAEEEMQTEVQAAKKKLKDDIAKMAIGAAEKIIQEKLDPQKHKKLIEDAISQAELK